MTTQFVLRTDLLNKAGRCPVQLIAYFDGLRLKCATGEKCKPFEWNEGRQRFRASFAGAEKANNFLELRAAQVSEWWRTMRAAGSNKQVPVSRLRLSLA
jgi:integrase/recombinase XerD